MTNNSDINTQVQLAREIIETTNANLFLTGKAGTGKTTFLRNLRKDSPKRMVVLAPTGIAAINAQGVTIHSFFQIAPGPFIPNTAIDKKQNYAMRAAKIDLICSLDLLVIDEVSMVRADLLDEIDEILRRIRRSTLPFGGVQLLLIGDMQQLSPVITDNEWDMLRPYYATPYFFSSNALRQSNYLTVELEKVYRQTDTRFLSLLNSIRIGDRSKQLLDELNKRYIANFTSDKSHGYIQLCTHNWQAQKINQIALDAIDEDVFAYKADIKGKFPDYSYPTDSDLQLKKGAQVMFVKNDTEKRYFNGMIGTIVSINNESFVVQPKDTNYLSIEVKPEVWQNTRYGIDPETKDIKEFVDGTFAQYPVKLAWAITIHKSQGLTFDNVLIDASKAFAHGQTYVALSRCRTLEGIVLTSPIPATAIINDPCIEAFNKEIKDKQVSQEQLKKLRVDYYLYLINELFNFEKECISFSRMADLLQKHLYNTYQKTTLLFGSWLHAFNLEVMNVAGRFKRQYQQAIFALDGNVTDDALQTRFKKGSAYFEQKLVALSEFVISHQLDIDNAQVKKEMNKAQSSLISQLSTHIELLKLVKKNGFVGEEYLNERAKIFLSAKSSSSSKKKKATAKSNDKYDVPTEVSNSVLYNKLREWRKLKAEELNLPAYCILQAKSMMAIADNMPMDEKQLKKIPYLGIKSIEKYGKDLLAIVNDYNQNLN